MMNSLRRLVLVSLFTAGACVAPSSESANKDALSSTHSIDGANIPAEETIVDPSGNTWGVKAGVVQENGSAAGYTASVVLVLLEGGTIYQENSSDKWWSWNGSGWSATSDPRVPSATGTRIPSASRIVDEAKNVWVVVSGVVYENGETAGYTANVVSLIYANETVYQENAAGNYWKWTGSTWASSENPVGGTPTPPSATLAPPTNFEMTHQGGSSVELSWTASSGASHYNIYRNGTAYATSAATSYTDNDATNATAVGYSPAGPATTYTYDITAVDASGHESAKASNLTAWVYHGGKYDWSNDYDYGSITVNYADTTGVPEDGPYDISINSDGGGWQPYSGAPFLTSDPYIWCMEIGAFHYMTIDLKPTKANQTWKLNIISRSPPGDIFNTASVTLPGTFGPAPKVGEWATYKVPFLPASGSADGSSLEVGYGKFEGSISGNTLTVTKMISGLNVQGGSWISGTGIAPNTWISGPDTGNGGPGVYTVSPAQNVASTEISAQRTNMYKFSLIDESNSGENSYYAERIGFTSN